MVLSPLAASCRATDIGLVARDGAWLSVSCCLFWVVHMPTLAGLPMPTLAVLHLYMYYAWHPGRP